jgi:Protein of unknown function, DUF547
MPRKPRGWKERLKRLALACGLLFCPFLAQAFDHEHRAWDALLKRHVVPIEGGKASQVRYSGVASERAALKSYLDSLSSVSESEFQRWSREEQMAFLINAYNAFTVEKILTRYPRIGSIWDFGRLFGNPFKDEFFVLLGGKRNLDWIEHETLRARYREPRIHYAVNCAAVGCPMLREEAFVAARLELQLEEQAERFLSDRSRNRVRAGRLEVSKIFDWFKEDFEPRPKYFARYARLLTDNPEERDGLAGGRLALRFLDYDWSLNDAKP